MVGTSAAIIGSWQLQSWRIEYGAGRVATFPFGPDADGLLIYAADGWMSAAMWRRRRSAWSAASARDADANSRAQAVEEFLSYGGRWYLDGSVLMHEVTFSVNPVLIGSLQRRPMQLDGEVLRLSSEETAAGGRKRQHHIEWRRVRPNTYPAHRPAADQQGQSTPGSSRR